MLKTYHISRINSISWPNVFVKLATSKLDGQKKAMGNTQARTQIPSQSPSPGQGLGDKESAKKIKLPRLRSTLSRFLRRGGTDKTNGVTAVNTSPSTKANVKADPVRMLKRNPALPSQTAQTNATLSAPVPAGNSGAAKLQDVHLDADGQPISVEPVNPEQQDLASHAEEDKNTEIVKSSDKDDYDTASELQQHAETLSERKCPPVEKKSTDIPVIPEKEAENTNSQGESKENPPVKFNTMLKYFDEKPKEEDTKPIITFADDADGTTTTGLDNIEVTNKKESEDTGLQTTTTSLTEEHNLPPVPLTRHGLLSKQELEQNTGVSSENVPSCLPLGSRDTSLQKSGCPCSDSSVSKRYHASSCSRRKVRCPDQRCPEKVRAHELLSHIHIAHPHAQWLGELEPNRYYKQCWNIRSRENFESDTITWVLTLWCFDSNVFVTMFQKYQGHWYDWIYVLGDEETAAKYKCKIKLKAADGRNAHYEGKVHSINKKKKDIRDSADCLIMTDENVLGLMTTDGVSTLRRSQGYDFRLPVNYCIFKV